MKDVEVVLELRMVGGKVTNNILNRDLRPREHNSSTTLESPRLVTPQAHMTSAIHEFESNPGILLFNM
jgi:hypothetical protein